MTIQAVIFDLDGVIVSTDEYHYLAWQQLADEEGIYFDRSINERLRGVSRMECVEILLEQSEKTYSEAQKSEMATRKNNYYLDYLDDLSAEHILPGVMDLFKQLRANDIKIAVGSSSRNSPAILEKIGLSDYFDATADGNEISKSKPDPEVFLLAAEKLGVNPEFCLVVEDAVAGVEAGINAGMKVLAVGSASEEKRAHFCAENVDSITIEDLLGLD